ncbi:hypothetical protein HMPREF9397_0386 [Streptococcus sanguinis SK1087]|uniref:Uncharacterized protein n=1 Tax=Streptococcus sanguinis SK1087 TaxID=888824 RepID=F3SGW4_STRSA|nr:hypothetical protein HMPREF9397_0386 [Streptococcus sanguinis SK1087]
MGGASTSTSLMPQLVQAELHTQHVLTVIPNTMKQNDIPLKI